MSWMYFSCTAGCIDIMLELVPAPPDAQRFGNAVLYMNMLMRLPAGRPQQPSPFNQLIE